MIHPSEGSGWEITAAALVRSIQFSQRRALFWMAMSKSVMPLYGRQSPLTGMATGAASPPGFPDDPEEHLLRQDAPGAPPIGAAFCVNGDAGTATRWQNKVAKCRETS